MTGGVAVGPGAGGIVLANQNGAVLMLSGRQMGLLSPPTHCGSCARADGRSLFMSALGSTDMVRAMSVWSWHAVLQLSAGLFVNQATRLLLMPVIVGLAAPTVLTAPTTAAFATTATA